MKSMKKGLAVLLAVLMMMPSMPVSADTIDSSENVSITEEVDVIENTENVEGEEIVEDEEVIEDKEAVEDEEVIEDEKTVENEMVIEGEETVEDETVIEDEEIVEDETVVENDEAAQDTETAKYDAEKILFNTGSAEFSVVTAEAFENGLGDVSYEEDGSYTINIPEENPFFPYEVQFTYDGETTEEWFMNPDDSVEVGGHTFYVSAYIDNTAITQMSLNVAGDEVIVYPEKKEFTNDGNGAMPISLLPLEERSLYVDLTGYTPVELTMVSVDSIFAGEAAIENTDNIIWTHSGEDDYTVSTTGDKLDLSRGTCYYGSTWEMIVGANDQLADTNIRYRVNVNTTKTEDWLTVTAYTQSDDGKRTNIPVTENEYYDYSEDSRRMYVRLSEKELGTERESYISLSVNPNVFEEVQFDHWKIFEGEYKTAEEAMTGTDITDIICNTDMSQTDAGYLVSRYGTYWITIVTFDAEGNVTGCLPFYLYTTTSSNEVNMSIYEQTSSGRNYNVTYSHATYIKNNCTYRTMRLYKGYAANATYYVSMTYYENGNYKNDAVTAAYVGQYASIAEAEAAGAENLKAVMFAQGYAADYSQGVYFTFFIGEDDSEGQEVLTYYVKTEETDQVSSGTSLNTSASLGFTGFVNSEGEYLKAYMVDSYEDSYAEFNYLTVLVGAEADLSNLAPEFWVADGAKLYTTGSSTPEISGKSYHDFSTGLMQYTVSSEDGEHSKNYWLQVVQPVDNTAKLYINSLKDDISKTTEENGIVYSKREIILDGYHDYVHDILVANVGTQAVTELSVTLESDVVELDDYWTLKGVYDLAGFNTVETTTSYGELPNLAKIRVKAKEGVESGNVSGKMTIKSGNETFIVLELTGTIGDPCIVTEEIPATVKYVPYGTMIQNNNKYSWNTVSYSMLSGTLPEGMILKSNGEIYGVPKETGEFTFTVRMDNSFYDFEDDIATFTLVIVENTDANVDAATDTGYDLSQRVQNVQLISGDTTTQTLVSEGVLAEFVDIYLDGEKLIEGQDYTAVSGSTRITIQNSTLSLAYTGNSDDVHTLGIEFRTQDTDVLKRAAQNFRIYGENSTGSNSGSSSSSGSSSNSGNSSNSGGSSFQNNIVSSTGNGSVVGTTAITYTVQPGDSLWKIAVKFYGSGNQWQKIFADNTNVLKDPNKIYAGQVLNIYLNSGVETGTQAVSNTYIVKRGDSLWRISKEIYGAGWFWKKIYNANKDKISNPNNLYVGQVLTIQ